MQLTNSAKDLLKILEEGQLKPKLKAYSDQSGKPTIGFGNTFYPDGSLVKMGDVISEQQANENFDKILSNFERNLKSALKVELNENQFSAVLLFAYNVGINNFKKSTLLKLVNENPNNFSIADEFRKWKFVTIKGKKLISNGLVNRREKEITLYFQTSKFNIKNIIKHSLIALALFFYSFYIANAINLIN